MKKRIYIVILTLLTIFLACPSYGATDQTDYQNLASQFNIKVQDKNGSPIENAKIFLYSYLDETTVTRDFTDNNGLCQMVYMPTADHISDDSVICADYIVYVEKEGYENYLYYLTKIYSDSMNFDTVNHEAIIIKLEEENTSSNLSMDGQFLSATDTYENAVHDYCTETGKISADSPIYILQESDKAEMARRGIIDPATRATIVETYSNIKIPVGEFHIDPHGYLDVKFVSSDSLKIETAMKTGIGSNEFRIGSALTRNFVTETKYPQFSTSGNQAQKRVYYAMGEFVLEETVIHSQGQIITTCRISSLYGGTERGTPTNCYTCSKNVDAVEKGDYGHYSPIDDGGSVAISDIKNKSTSLGLSVNIDGAIPSLGVTRTTSSSTEFKFTPKSGYDLRAYDYDGSFKTWHVTSRPAR